MGAAITQVVASSGLTVVMYEMNEELVQKAMKRIRSAFQREQDKGKISKEKLHERLALINGTTSLKEFFDVDLVIEAVPEIMEIKKKVFTSLEQATSPQTILASNTSSLSISEIASTLKDSQKVIGLHFFNPPQKMKLVEVIPALQTSTKTIETAVDFVRLVGRESVVVTECAGFLVNRLLVPYFYEAMYTLLDGSAGIQDIDNAAMQYGFPMGPFRLCDFIGIDTLVHSGRIMEQYYGPRMKPPFLMEEMVRAELLGDKSGGGFYKGNQINPDVLLLIENLKTNSKHTVAFTTERLIYPMINEAVICLQEKYQHHRKLISQWYPVSVFQRTKGDRCATLT